MLNARRHRRGNHVWLWGACSSGGTVLNARRHRRGNHEALPLWGDVAGLCSTPEGIGGGITPLPGVGAAPKDTRAQRPKASEGESPSPNRPRRRCRTPLCSTPEGIGGGITSEAFAVCKLGAVLNARRHRRGNHRVEASTSFDSSGAQRPKASEGESLFVDIHRHFGGRVLNARRHRRGNHA